MDDHGRRWARQATTDGVGVALSREEARLAVDALWAYEAQLRTDGFTGTDLRLIEVIDLRARLEGATRHPDHP